MTHTPGPWRAHFAVSNQRFKTGRWVWFAPDQNFPGHEVLVDVEKRNGTGEANARLIAAAPELFDSLVDLLEKAELVDEELTGPADKEYFPPSLLAKARAALAKATGLTATP